MSSFVYGQAAGTCGPYEVNESDIPLCSLPPRRDSKSDVEHVFEVKRIKPVASRKGTPPNQKQAVPRGVRVRQKSPELLIRGAEMFFSPETRLREGVRLRNPRRSNSAPFDANNILHSEKILDSPAFPRSRSSTVTQPTMPQTFRLKRSNTYRGMSGRQNILEKTRYQLAIDWL